MVLFRIIVLVFLFSVSAEAQWKGELFFSPQWGGTNFSEQNGSFEHVRSWSFFYNMGYSLGLKGSFKTELVAIGIGGEYGWKEERMDRLGGNSSSAYAFQISRLLVGPYVNLNPFRKGPVHFHLGYDPLVTSTVIYTQDNSTNPFDKNEKLKGYSYSFGVGIDYKSTLVRILGRRIVYNDVEFEGTQRKLPDSTYSVLMTSEFVLQIGSTF